MLWGELWNARHWSPSHSQCIRHCPENNFRVQISSGFEGKEELQAESAKQSCWSWNIFSAEAQELRQMQYGTVLIVP